MRWPTWESGNETREKTWKNIDLQWFSHCSIFSSFIVQWRWSSERPSMWQQWPRYFLPCHLALSRTYWELPTLRGLLRNAIDSIGFGESRPKHETERIIPSSRRLSDTSDKSQQGWAARKASKVTRNKTHSRWHLLNGPKPKPTQNVAAFHSMPSARH